MLTDGLLLRESRVPANGQGTPMALVSNRGWGAPMAWVSNRGWGTPLAWVSNGGWSAPMAWVSNHGQGAPLAGETSHGRYELSEILQNMGRKLYLQASKIWEGSYISSGSHCKGRIETSGRQVFKLPSYERNDTGI